MCDWCLDSSCSDGEKCRYARCRNPFIGSLTFQRARRRVENVTGPLRTAPGVFWSGNRPGIIPEIRDHVLASSSLCGICHRPIASDDLLHADHITPWYTYVQRKITKVSAKSHLNWSGGAVPLDFVCVLFNDPHNLQPAHDHCNHSKSDAVQGEKAGTTRRIRKAEAEAATAARRRKEQERVEREIAAWWACHELFFDQGRRGRDPDRDPDPDPDGGGILA